MTTKTETTTSRVCDSCGADGEFGKVGSMTTVYGPDELRAHELDPADDWHLQAELGRAHDAGLLQEGPAARVAYLEKLVGDAWRLMAREDRCQEAQIMLRNEVRAMRRGAKEET